MDLNRDELRRHLRDAEQQQRTAVRSLREMLKRYFNGEPTALTTEAKADLLGVPAPNSRRQFFAFGGATLLSAAVLAACGDDSDPAETGTAPTTGAPETTTTTAGETTTTASPEASTDLVLARTAASVELAAVAAYQAAIDSGLVTTQAVVDAAVLFQAHHEEHAGVFNATVRDAGGDEVTEPNAFVMENVVGTADLSSELAIVQFARTLEDAAASTYVLAAGVLSTPLLRQAVMSVGGVEARHVTALDLALQALGEGSGPPFEDGAFYSSERAVPEDAYLS